MKTNVMPSVIQIEKESLNKLIAEVKETIAHDIKVPSKGIHKKFGIADLWNCHRNIRSAVSMRRH